MGLEFVNVFGEVISQGRIDAAKAQATLDAQRAKRQKDKPKAFHKGWRVMGFPPGALQQAQADHRAKQRDLEAKGKPTTDFDMQAWLNSGRRKPVRSKPYEVAEAATACKQLAEKTGWLGVQVIAISSE